MEDANIRAATARKGCPYLNTEQAAYHLGLSPRTLQTMRRTGKGPRFRRHGSLVRYHIDDLGDWSEHNGEAAGNA